MSTTHYSPSRSAVASEVYVRGVNNDRGVAISSDVPGGPGAWSRLARALTEASNREVQALHYRQSFSKKEFDPTNPQDLQLVNDLGYLLAKKMHPHADALVVTHIDGKGGHPHNHVLIINHDRESGKALDNYRTFHDRPEQSQHGVKSANDALMRQQGRPVVPTFQLAPIDWEIRREDFAEDSLDRQMGDRMQAALHDPRSVDEDALRVVLGEQNEQVDDYGDPVPRMRLVTSTHKKTAAPVWTLKIQDKRDDARRSERRAKCSRLSADFTPEGAAAFFDYHQQREQDDERRTRAVEAAERARQAAAAARDLRRDVDDLDLDPRRRRGTEQEGGLAADAGQEAGGLREGHGRGAGEDAGEDGTAALALLERYRRREAERAARLAHDRAAPDRRVARVRGRAQGNISVDRSDKRPAEDVEFGG